MNILHLVKVRFDRRRTDINQEWLNHRYKFFAQHTLPSLLAQTKPGNHGAYTDWVLWINCDPGMREMVSELKTHLAKVGVQALWSFGDESPCPADLPTRADFDRLATCDYVYVTRIDSDDLFTNDALWLARSTPPREVGEVEASIFRRGYIYDMVGKRLGVYFNPSSPFHTIMYPKDVFVDPEWYTQVWDRIGDHSRVESALYSHPLPHFKFCVLVHGSNFLSTFDYSREIEGTNSWLPKGWNLGSFLKQPVVFDVDDFCDEEGGVRGDTVLSQLDNLKCQYPNFRCTLFTIPEHTSKQLLYRARSKGWIELAVHGINHRPNLELKSVGAGQLLSYLGTEIDYSVYARGFRPPGWYITKEHVEACNQLGMWIGLNYRDSFSLGKMCQYGYYVCGECLPYWHGHTHNVCGNWLGEHLAELLSMWHPLQEFSFVSEAVLVPPAEYALLHPSISGD